MIDCYIWLALKGVLFGQIVTEKVMNSAIEMRQVGSNWIRIGKGVHLLDEYLIQKNGYIALEIATD